MRRQQIAYRIFWKNYEFFEVLFYRPTITIIFAILGSYALSLIRKRLFIILYCFYNFFLFDIILFLIVQLSSIFYVILVHIYLEWPLNVHILYILILQWHMHDKRLHFIHVFIFAWGSAIFKWNVNWLVQIYYLVWTEAFSFIKKINNIDIKTKAYKNKGNTRSYPQ